MSPEWIRDNECQPSTWERKSLFPLGYEAELREQTQKEVKRQKDRVERFLRKWFEHLQPVISYANMGQLCHVLTWLSYTLYLRIPFAINVWIECNTKDILHGNQKVEVKAAILFLCLKGVGRGTRFRCSACALSVICWLSLVVVRQQPDVYLLHLPSDSLTLSLAPGPSTCLASWQRVPSFLLQEGVDMVWRW